MNVVENVYYKNMTQLTLHLFSSCICHHYIDICYSFIFRWHRFLCLWREDLNHTL